MKFQDDGFLASFNSAHAGLHAAVELQRTFAAGPAEQRSLAIRVGAALGFRDRQPRADDGAQRGARLPDRRARPRAARSSSPSSAREYTQTDPSFRFEEHGEYHFKGLLGEHVVYSLLWR